MYQEPWDMVREIFLNEHSFILPDQLFIDWIGYTNFQGRRYEVSESFRYRLYDTVLISTLKLVVAYINCSEWQKANQFFRQNRKTKLI